MIHEIYRTTKLAFRQDANGDVAGTHIESGFDKTKINPYLKVNATQFSFEVCFPQSNVQGVGYETCYWQFVGDCDSLETFYKARNLKPVKTP